MPFLGKREKAMLAELEKACTDKIAAAEDSLKKKKQVSVLAFKFFDVIEF